MDVFHMLCCNLFRTVKEKNRKMMTRKQGFTLLLALMILACGCSASAEKLELPHDLKTVPEEAFFGDESLTEVVLPEGLETIGSKAFKDCSLTRITLPDSIVFIADDAFDEPGTIEVVANEGSYAYQWARENQYITDEIITREETVQETVRYTTETVSDSDRPEGDPDIVVQEGRNGIRTVVYTVCYRNGTEISRTEKSSEITTPAVNRIISVATGEFTVSYETVTVTVPYTTVYEDAPNWRVGEEAVATEGQDGLKEVVYQVRKDKNGNEISRTVYSETITKNAVNKVIYRGTFVPVVTYTYVTVPDLPECDPDRRTAALDEACAEWAMTMALNDKVEHSNHDWGESVGAWASMDGVVYGRNYTVISTQNGQTYSGNVSLGSHGGEMLATGTIWGAGCVIRSETQPDGSTVDVYYACARSE